MAVNELPMITVHTDERLPIEFAPETHGISKPIEWGDGKRLAYIAPLEQLDWLSGEAPPPPEESLK